MKCRFPNTIRAFLHAQQWRLNTVGWFNAKRSEDGYANDHLARQAYDILRNKDQVEKEYVDTVASFDIGPSKDSFGKATPLHDNERYIEKSSNIITDPAVEQTQPRHVDDTVERNRVQIRAADLLESDSSDGVCDKANMPEADFDDDSSETVTSVGDKQSSGLYTPDAGSTMSCCSTPRGKETPVGKSRSPCITPRSSARDDLEGENSFTPVWHSQSSVQFTTPVRQSQSPVYKSNDDEYVPNTSTEAEEVKRECDEDCDATEDMYSEFVVVLVAVVVCLLMCAWLVSCF